MNIKITDDLLLEVDFNYEEIAIIRKACARLDSSPVDLVKLIVEEQLRLMRLLDNAPVHPCEEEKPPWCDFDNSNSCIGCASRIPQGT